MGDITKNFSHEEFFCHCGKCNNNAPPATFGNIEKLVKTILQPLRDMIGEPIIITSGIRCKKQNAEVGGAKNSQHLQGKAADIIVKTYSPKQLAKKIESLPVGGIGLYPGFVHVDIGPKGRRW